MKKLLILSFLYLVSCASVPMTGRKQFIAIPSSQMIALSDESYSKVLEESQLSANSQYVNRVKIVGERLSRAVESYLKPMNWDSISWPWLDMIQELHLISGNEWRQRAVHVRRNFYPRIQIPPIELRI
jgi:hypothetical protein